MRNKMTNKSLKHQGVELVKLFDNFILKNCSPYTSGNRIYSPIFSFDKHNPKKIAYDIENIINNYVVKLNEQGFTLDRIDFCVECYKLKKDVPHISNWLDIKNSKIVNIQYGDDFNITDENGNILKNKERKSKTPKRVYPPNYTPKHDCYNISSKCFGNDPFELDNFYIPYVAEKEIKKIKRNKMNYFCFYLTSPWSSI